MTWVPARRWDHIIFGSEPKSRGYGEIYAKRKTLSNSPAVDRLRGDFGRVVPILGRASHHAHDAPMENRVIHACVNSHSGEIKISGFGDDGSSSSDDDSSSSSDDGSRSSDVAIRDCNKKDIELDWNAVGPQGPQGTDGQDGLSGYVMLRQTIGDAGVPAVVLGRTLHGPDSSGLAEMVVDCGSDKKAIGGGYSIGGGAGLSVFAVDNEPWPRTGSNAGQGWRVLSRHPGNSTNYILYVSATCVTAGS